MVTSRRVRLSQAIWSGWTAALDGAWAAVASVIGLSLLPLAARQREITEQRRHHQERDHRHGDRRALAQLAAGDAALEGECRHEVGGVQRAAAGDGVDQLEVGEGEDDRE